MEKGCDEGGICDGYRNLRGGKRKCRKQLLIGDGETRFGLTKAADELQSAPLVSMRRRDPNDLGKRVNGIETTNSHRPEVTLQVQTTDRYGRNCKVSQLLRQ